MVKTRPKLGQIGRNVPRSTNSKGRSLKIVEIKQKAPWWDDAFDSPELYIQGDANSESGERPAGLILGACAMSLVSRKSARRRIWLKNLKLERGCRKAQSCAEFCKITQKTFLCNTPFSYTPLCVSPTETLEKQCRKIRGRKPLEFAEKFTGNFPKISLSKIKINPHPLCRTSASKTASDVDIVVSLSLHTCRGPPVALHVSRYTS